MNAVRRQDPEIVAGQREDTAWQIAAVVKVIVQAIVDYPHQVVVTPVIGTQAVIIEVEVAPDDNRRVIGRKGRTANAIRELLVNISGKQGMRVCLELVEPQR